MAAPDLLGTWKGLEVFGAIMPPSAPTTTILNSSHSRYPLGTDPWIPQTQSAVRSLAEERAVVLSSVGSPNWDFLTWAAGDADCFLGVLLPAPVGVDPRPHAETILHDFSLNPGRTCFAMLPERGTGRRDSGPFRDRWIVEHADTIVPISIRPGGRMDGLLQGISTDPRVLPDFRIPFVNNRSYPPYRFRVQDIRREVDPLWKESLIHWTRAASGPWPGETLADYFRAVCSSGARYARSARVTLARIRDEQLLRASNWKIRGKHAAVCFSSLPPSRATERMRWRKRYLRYPIEPFGIAIRAEVARSLGICPVMYVGTGTSPANGSDPLAQAIGTSGFWPAEQEYRHLGDLDLAALPEGSWGVVDLSPYVESGPQWG
ncbi:MAG: hypothetical protein HUU16_09965 [Candidatus Omnitrophica bacterium]|nr:hypothetical protein [bacterium]NUN96487.1 hypothetical protein [Candidatus Omnitrophota bacterium]